MSKVEAIADTKRVAQELAETNARLRLAMDAGRMAVWDVDVVTGDLVASPELNRLLDFPDGKPLSVRELRARYLPNEGNRVREGANAALARGERYFEVEFRYRWRDGSIHWMQLRAEIIHAEGLAPLRVLGVLLDITDRKEAEERLKLLAREVDHRANNLLAVAQAAVRLSEADTVGELKETIEGRIRALAHAHNLLSRSRWTGANLKQLVSEELKPYLAEDKVDIHGPSVVLRPEAAQSIAMVIHELCTNATKYGAFKAAEGKVSVEWRLEDGALKLVWSESGASDVKKPTRRGFGVGMVVRAMAQLKGQASFDWRPEGLVCEITLPAERLA
ncbi:MAG: HWE histidine kinase domain-containing protein [Ignavibacteriales bacterium]